MNLVLQYLVYRLVKLFYWSYRFETVGERPPRTALRPGAPPGYIFAIWHQNLFAGILAQTGFKHTVIVSRSADGDPVAFVCQKLGHHVARGSSKRDGVDKGGKLAKDEMIEVLKTGIPGAITVDGPKGPVFEVKPGIIDMARQTGLPIISYLPVPQSFWTLKSWDAFRIPKPFSRIRIYYGTPRFIDPSTPFEAFAEHQQAIAAELNAMENAYCPKALAQRHSAQKSAIKPS
jgi:lysophospholipid acyltransferase (LPLAT)-like uncharacterized protein